MSNHSEFMILVGSGHHYEGEGFLMQSCIFQHMKEGGWFLNTEKAGIYWLRDHLEDAFLMISLYLVAPFTEDEEDENPFKELLYKAKDCFKRGLFEHGMDTEDKKHITPSKLKSLYELNRKTLSDSNVKLVAVQLGKPDELREEMKDQFINITQKYDLKNVEFMESTYGREHGGFCKSK